jgi:hypothetical protein
MERRELFPILAAVPLAELPLAAQHEHHRPAKIFADDYRLRAFTEAEDRTLSSLADIVIPDDERSPGAGAARVSRYFDLMAHYVPRIKEGFARGLAAVEAESARRFQQSFARIGRERQTEIVSTMAAHEGAPESELERFFALLKHQTVEGYRLSHIGQTQWIGYKPHPGGLYPDDTLDSK